MKTYLNLNNSWLRLVIVFALIGIAFCIDFSTTINAILSPYQNEFSAGMIAVVSLLAFYLLNTGKPFVDYLLACIPYGLVTAKFVFSSYLPVHDSWKYHLPVFSYIGEILTQGHLFPKWIPASGGVRIGFFHINFPPFFPHKILGYFLYSIFPISDVVAYKLQYILGVIFMCFGWWLFLQKFTHSRYAAYLGTLAIMMGGTGITFHQESVLASVHLFPWFVLSLWELQDDSAYIFPTIVLFGLGLTILYPQIQFLSMGLLTVFLFGLHPVVVIKNIYNQQKQFTVLLVILFIIALLPALYLFYNIDFLASSHRNIRAETYEAYSELQNIQFSSALPKYFYQYITPIIAWHPQHNYRGGFPVDYSFFFVGRILLIIALFGAVFRFPKTIPIIVLLGIFTALTLGIHCIIPIPKFFYFIRFPFINSFRQWIHFFPMVNFCLSTLGAISIVSLEIYFYRTHYRKVIGIVIMIIIFIQLIDLSMYDKKYLATFWANTTPANLTDDFFSREDRGPVNLFQYKNRYILYHFCPEAIPPVSFLTTDITSVTGGINSEIETTCKSFFQGRKSTITNIPLTKVQTFLSGEYYANISCHDCVQPDGLVFDVTTPKPALFVTPLNYDINAKVYIDGKETSIWRINGALSGVLVDRGEHRIEFRIPHDVYILTVLVQLALYMFLIVFFVRKRAKIINQKG